MFLAQEPIARSRLLLLLIAAAVLWFGNLEYRKLLDPDEGRYAEIPREMVASADWVTPRLNGIKYFEKPPLQYWATAIAYEAFGETQWASRLWTALTGFLTVLLVYAAGVRLFGAESGLYAAFMLVSSAGFVLAGHINTLDMGLTFFLTLAVVTFLIAQENRGAARTNALWMHAAWAAAAGAVLSKGLIGAVVPAGGLVAYTLLTRDWAAWRRLHLVTGCLLFLALTAPWFVLVSLANPEFPAYFFIHEHFQRFLTTVHLRYQPWWYFLPVLALGLLPWTTLVPPALVSAWRTDAASRAFRPRRFLLAYAAFTLLFFSASSSKLEAYVLPMLPALALLLGAHAAALPPQKLRWHLSAAVITGLAVLSAPSLLQTFVGGRSIGALLPAFGAWLHWAGAVLIAGGVYGMVQAGRGNRRPALIGTAFAALIASQLGNTGMEALSPLRSGYDLALKIAPLLRSETPFYGFGVYEQTLPFYLKRTITLVASAEEMAFGLEQEPELWIPDPLEFERIWHDQPGAIAIMQPQHFELFESRGLPMREIARDALRVVVMRP